MLHKVDMSALQLVTTHSPCGVNPIALTQIVTNAVRTFQKPGQALSSGLENGHQFCKEGTQSKGQHPCRGHKAEEGAHSKDGMQSKRMQG